MLAMFFFGFILPVSIVSIFYILVWRILKSRNHNLNTPTSESNRNENASHALMPNNNQQFSFVIEDHISSSSKKNNSPEIRANNSTNFQSQSKSSRNLLVTNHFRHDEVSFDSVLYRPKEMCSLYSKKEIKLTKTLISFVIVFLMTW